MLHAVSAGEVGERARLRVGLVCGGPSEERGISLNSARSVLDHLTALDVEIVPFYVDVRSQWFRLDRGLLYCNTPSDFDFKLGQRADSLLSDAGAREALGSLDVVFPAMHGRYGEDGGVQALLEEVGVPYVGSSSAACRTAFDKASSMAYLKAQGFDCIPSLLLDHDDGEAMPGLADIAAFMDSNPTLQGRYVIKPARAGSSIGVSVVTSAAEALQAAQRLHASVDSRCIIEPFVEGGAEFTVIVLEPVGGGAPVALVPTEVHLPSRGDTSTGASTSSTAGGEIFDYRKKYLPTRSVTYHTPPRFSRETTDRIRADAAKAFQALGLRDFARLDGWVLPPASADSPPRVVFSDINTVSGMEQTSFLFIQASQIGLSHADVLRHVLRTAAARSGISLPVEAQIRGAAVEAASAEIVSRKPVYVLFGGKSSERQVSLMSGTNVWLKLLRSELVEATPFLLSGEDGVQAGDTCVWSLPYPTVLRHTVEEVSAAALQSQEPMARALLAELRAEVFHGLRLDEGQTRIVGEGTCRRMTLPEFIAEAKASGAIVFIAVHGGIGENGVLQGMLSAAGLTYTGSGAEASELCADKSVTGKIVAALGDADIGCASKSLRPLSDLVTAASDAGPLWRALEVELLGGRPGAALCVKPNNDGCSTGVARLEVPSDLQTYATALRDGWEQIPPGSFAAAHAAVEMPGDVPSSLLFEEFIETDPVCVDDRAKTVTWKGESRWVEVTIGVMGTKGALRALPPSITVAAASILSLEEKFQGGTGINLTPPPEFVVPAQIVDKARRNMERVANALGIEGFARIDAFLHADTGALLVIEANTVPGMTPSTVIYHQALAEGMAPREWLETVISYAEL